MNATTLSRNAPEQADYGIDAPGVIRNLALAGIAAAILAVAVPSLHWTAVLAVCFGIEVCWMLYASKIGKMHKRDIILDNLHLTGSEHILDIGCGRGLLLIGAAKRLTSGTAIGVDLWSQTDLSSNSMDATLANARIEGVIDRVDVRTGDARALPLADASVDAVVSSLALHNIADTEGRAQAIREAVRVLKPGGEIVIQDIRYTRQYMRVLEQCNMDDVRRTALQLRIFPPSRIVRAEKKA